MQGCLSEREVTAFVEGKASVEQSTSWKRHLRICDSCAATVARARAGLEPVPTTSDQTGAETDSNAAECPLIGLEPNVQLGDFKLEKRLGVGGMGVVYQALQISLNRRVALKILPLGFGGNAASVERFHREARAAAKLRHRNIVTVHAEGAENNVCYFAMEMLDGRNLDQVIKDLRAARRAESRSAGAGRAAGEDGDAADEVEGGPPEATGQCGALRNCKSDGEYFNCVARLVSEVADALDYAHSEGIIHRDVKPSNLLLARDGRLVLLDFGIARVREERAMTLTGSFVGTPRYMSPEQIADGHRKLDHRCDIYSLGVTFYELLTLEPLFDGDTQQQIMGQILTREPRRPRQVSSNVPADLDTICRKAIEKDPDRRYQSAGAMAEDLRRYLSGRVIKARPPGLADLTAKFVRRHAVAVVMTSVIVVVSVIAASIAWKHYTTQWAQQYAMVQIDEFIEQKNYFDAFLLATRAQRYIPDDPLLVNRWPRLAREHTIITDPPGARVYLSKYRDQPPNWEYLGRSPIRGVRVPFGTHRWKVERAKYMPLLVVLSNDYPSPRIDPAELTPAQISFTLHKNGTFDSDMVWIPPSTLSQADLYHGTRTIPAAPAYLIDKCEVTNRRYREFVDAGGYEKQEFWEHEFVKEGRMIPWSQALEEFRDQTGSRGPATWRDGTYPPGEADCPVRGISWYEAAAYARFTEKDLPTIFHWTRAARAEENPSRISLLSNFGDGPAPVGYHVGMGRYGLYDAAGNVREWCYNTLEDAGEVRCILGGTWSDQRYAFAVGAVASAWDRDAGTGFRCAQYLGGRENVPEEAFAPVEHKHRDFSSFQPVSGEVFKSYLDTWYRYDKTELNAWVEAVDEDLGYCRRERITFDAAYPNERVIALLYLPANAIPPYQLVVWYPGGEARRVPWSDKEHKHEMTTIIKSGRALTVPFYKGTYERRLDKAFYPPEGIQSRNLYVQRSQDMRRTIDYLETRGDIDPDKIAFVGVSWGGQMGSVMIAVEERFKAGILCLGGICACKRHPASDPANFAPRVKIPILMLNGKDDSLFPYETAQKPLLNLLGTPETEKKHILFPGEHCIPWEYQELYYTEIVKWLDRYLGPTAKIADETQSTSETGAAAGPAK